jgi:outer membrane lipoprotein SlyB
VGDTFKATVVSPSTYESATVEGHIATLNKSGRVSGKTEMGLAFDTLTLSDGRQTRIDADLVKVYESENVKKVDDEGRVESGSRTRDSQVRGGVGAAAGAIIGGIVGGGKGAVIGLILGGAAGVGSVYVEGNKDLILEPGTEMVIRTVGPKER